MKLRSSISSIYNRIWEMGINKNYIYIKQLEAIFITFPCRYWERICHYKIILHENSSGFMLRSLSNSASLCSLSFSIAFSNFSEGLSITIGSFVYDINLMTWRWKDKHFFQTTFMWTVFFGKNNSFSQNQLPRIEYFFKNSSTLLEIRWLKKKIVKRNKLFN